MKKFTIFFSIILLISCKTGFSQTTIYSQNFGVSPITGFPAGWTESGGTTGWYLNSSSPSTGYSGASGAYNVRAGAQTTADTLNYSSVSTTGYSNISVIWGARRSSTTSPSPVFQWSSDSITWNSVTFTDVATNGTWALVNSSTRINLPAGAAGVTNLRFRWMVTATTGAGSLRLDDFSVQGTQVSSLPPSKISIVSVNGGANPDSCSSFNVIVQTVDTNGIPSNVTSAANVSLTKLSGNGSGVLSGGSGTIPSGQNSCTITVSYSTSETGVSLLASCGSLTTDTSNVFIVNPCIANLPSCFSWDTLGGVTQPYPPGWFNYGLGTPFTFGHTGANSGNFDTQGDSLVIHFNSSSDTVVFYLTTYNFYGGTYQFDVFESTNGLNYTTLHSFTSGLTANPTWTGYTYIPLTTSRFIKFVYTTKPTGPGSNDIAIDDICIKHTQISSLQPSKISIVSVNGGLAPDTCHSFNVVVQTLDINGILSNVTSASTVTLTKLTGNGSGVLSGGTGTIPSGQNSCIISVTYSTSETGVSLLASCGSLTTDTSNVFIVNPCVANLPTCYAWDLDTAGNVLPFPFGWYSYGLGTPNTTGNMAPKSGNFDTQGDSLLIRFNNTAGSIRYYLQGVTLGGTYRFDVLESSNGLNYSTLNSYSSIGTTWTLHIDTPLTTSRYIKFVYSIKAFGNVAIDDICLFLPPSVAQPSKLKILSVNNGLAPDSCNAFKVVVQSQDSNSNPANCSINTGVSLSVNTGTPGAFTFITGMIMANTNIDTITVNYNKVESGVSLIASQTSGLTLSPDTCATFNVDTCITYISASLPTCYSWDYTGTTLDSYPTGWYNFGLTYSTIQGYAIPYCGRFPTPGDSLSIYFNSIADSVVFWLRGNTLSGVYRFDLFESAMNYSYSSVATFDSSAAHAITNSVWTHHGYALNPASRIVKFVFTTRVAVTGSIYIDSVCVYGTPLGIKSQITESNEINIYPNPVNSSLFIDNISNIEKISITNIFGRRIKVFENIKNNNLEFSVNDLSDGIYLITFYDKNGNYKIRKFVKEK